MSKGIASTGPIQWTQKEASVMFNISNVIGFCAVTVMLMHAIESLKKSGSTLNPALVVFPSLFCLDLLIRYPLLIGNPTTKWTLRFFIVYYAVVAVLFSFPWIKYWSIGYGVVLAVIIGLWLGLTRSEQSMYSKKA